MTTLTPDVPAAVAAVDGIARVISVEELDGEIVVRVVATMGAHLPTLGEQVAAIAASPDQPAHVVIESVVPHDDTRHEGEPS